MTLTSEGVQELVFAPGILKVVTNRPDLRGFIFGKPPVPGVDTAGRSTRVTLEYLVRKGGLEAAVGRDVIFRSRPIPGGFRASRAIDLTDRDRLRLHVDRGYLAWSKLRFTGSHPTPEAILSNLAVVGLLGQGLVPLHGGAVTRGDEATLLFAPSNTGKTYSTWRLVSEFACEFLGDDLLATDGEIVSGFPFTSTGVPPGVRAPRQPITDHFRKAFMLYPNKPRLVDAVGHHRVRDRAAIRRIVFLRRGESRTRVVGSAEAADAILRLNRLEFKYLGSEYLANGWWRYGFPDLQALALKEFELIERLVDAADEIIEIRSDDPAQFSPLIAEAMG